VKPVKQRKWLVQPDFLVERDADRCIQCQVCVRQCANDVHEYDADEELVRSDSACCVGCHRCATLCPTGAVSIKRAPLEFRPNANFTTDIIRNVYKQAESGGMLLSSMGNDKPFPIYWDRMLLNASQVTNPSIDPLREPMELLTYLGRKPARVEFAEGPGGARKMSTQLDPQLRLKIPLMFSAMSYGSISYNAAYALARAAKEAGTFANSGEGGLHKTSAATGRT